MVLHREKTRTMVLCAMFVVLIAAGAWIKIPVPVVPFTLQYLFTMLAGILLGEGAGRWRSAFTWRWDWQGCRSLPREAG